MRRVLASTSMILSALAMFCLLAIPAAHAQSGPHVLITQNVDESKTIQLSGNTRPEAQQPKNDRGRVSDGMALNHMLLQLKRSPEQERELQTYIEGLTDRSSTNFHQWLTAAEYGERFGVAEQDRATITRWLQGHGFTVNVEYSNGVVIDFSGTAGQVRDAFHTEIHQIVVKGQKHIANVSDPKIPAALAPAVVGVVSLHDFRPHTNYKPKKNYTVGNGYYLVTPADLATIYNFTPLFAAGNSGQGQTVVVVEDTNVYSTTDWTTFRSTFGLSSYTAGTFTQVHPAPPSGTNNCSNPGVNGDDGEAILDAEYASAAAPSAAIELISCADTQTSFGGMIAMQNLLNESSAPPAIMSVSYGECEAENGASQNAAFNSLYQQAVTEGVSVFVSAGDSAAAGCDDNEQIATHGIAVSGLGETVYNVSVGGTDFGDTYAGTNTTYWNASNTSAYGSAKSYIPEIPWNDSCASVLLANYEGSGTTYGSTGFCNTSTGEQFLGTAGGSGGPSECATGSPSISGVVSGSCAGYAKPSWQSLVGNPSDGVRDVPDVSLFAANGLWGHYYPFCYTDPNNGGTACTGAPSGWSGAGGTSFASPIMAAIQALINQKAGGRQGNPNPTYYQLAATEYGAAGDSACNSTLGNTVGSSCSFYDVTLGDMDVNCTGTHNCYLPSGTNGVLSTSSSAYDKAYGAQTGWDFATGIGTVNATNLANNWPSTTQSFTLAASPNSVTVVQGNQGTSTVTVTDVNGFTGSVALTATGLPSGVTASFSPTSTTSTSTLTLTASSTAATGTVVVTIHGTSGSLTKTTTLSLTVNSAPTQGFTLAASPTTVTVAKGGPSETTTVSITPVNGFSGNVTLAATGLPTGVTASFSPNPATSSSVLTLTASSTAAAKTVTVTVTGTSGSTTAKTTFSLKVVALGNFSIIATPATLKVAQGASGTSALTVKPTGGFDQEVTLSASGLPTGVTASFSTNPTTSTSTLTLTVGGTAAVGKSTITITGVYGSLSHTRAVTLTVTAAN